ncbi:MAG: DNA replication/repair protein RecF [Clostridia bacterium]|nr:DNA replication/repair protein RecF [Clostridia bacterium]
MFITDIDLINFRNYGRLNLEVGPSVNVICGKNAQGKTNIIESVNFCSCLTSHRTHKERELVKFNENEFCIKLNLCDEIDNYKTDLCVKYDLNTQKRKLFQDNSEIRKISSYLGICNTVMFVPEDLNIVKGAPGNRRKFLNVLISKISPVYFDLINAYVRILNQKNVYLKKYYGNIDENILEYYDLSLADLSAKIVFYRLRFVMILSDYACVHHSRISNNSEKIELTYNSIPGLIELLTQELINELGENYKYNLINDNIESVKRDKIQAVLSDYILNKIKASRSNDIERRVVSVALNKDDIDIKLNDLSMRSYSSQGQQRSAALSLKLAELDCIRTYTSTSPILLLDDVFSELDKERRSSLITNIKNTQIFITCTDKEFILNEIIDIDSFDSLRFYNVDNGVISADN